MQIHCQNESLYRIPSPDLPDAVFFSTFASMKHPIDIRDIDHLPGEAVFALNFIKNPGRYFFRKHYRHGLRSHIFEVLTLADVAAENSGRVIDGIRVFPRARPVKMFRILRQRFDTVDAVFAEIRKYNLLLKCLGPDLIARSEEFVVEYTGTGKSQIVLCGLQEYIDGQVLDPWRMQDARFLSDTFQQTALPEQVPGLVETAKNRIAMFVHRVRSMIEKTGFIPDLAGVGNLMLTRDGQIKLVDINNIAAFPRDNSIFIDDKGYPSCDVSIDVLWRIETHLLGRPAKTDDPVYQRFLSPERRQKVKALEKEFYSAC